MGEAPQIEPNSHRPYRTYKTYLHNPPLPL